jgi:hypothetical protein
MARISYSYLGAVVAGIMTGVVAIIAWPIFHSLPVCREDPRGYCGQVLTSYLSIGVMIISLFVVGYLLRLGWQWACWMVMVSLVILQLLIDFNQMNLGWLFPLVPLAAGFATYGLSDKPPPRHIRWIRYGLLAILLVQFIVWLVILLTS